jgi:hypothetical protein
MRSCEAIKEQLIDENPDALLADGYDEALIGIGRRISQPALAIYDREKCIEILCREMNLEEAEEFFEFNVSGSWMGPNTPIFLQSF